MSSGRCSWLRQVEEEWVVPAWGPKKLRVAMAVEAVEMLQEQAQGRLDRQVPSHRQYGFFSVDGSKVRARHRHRHHWAEA